MGTWKQVEPGLWVGEYLNGSNPINTSIVDMGDGSLMALSPGIGFTAADFDELDKLGTITALVSPGAFHHLGFPVWKERYPAAGIYGPESSIDHIAKQQPGLEAVQPFSMLRGMLSDDFELGELEGCKHPDIFLALQREGQTTWFSNEILTNAADYPSNLFFKFVFWVSGNKPGLIANTLTARLIGADKAAVRRFYEGKLSSVPPTRLVPCHGDVVQEDGLAGRVKAALADRF